MPLPTIPKKRTSYKIAKRSKKNKEKLINNKNENKVYYNITDIKTDTQWSDVSIQSKASTHLSLISQSKVDFKLVHKYDNNFYYPSTAGEGVDIYILDDGLNTNHIDFNTTYRNITCDGETRSNTFIEYEPSSPEIKNCTNVLGEQDHGISVASVAAGTIYGVAKKANIHVIAIDLYVSHYLTALNYIIEKAKDPHKTIINMSFGGYVYRSIFDKQLNVLANKGFMIFASAGNEATDACSTNIREAEDEDDDVNDKFYPAGYTDIIAIGGMDNYSPTYFYNKEYYSNYGSCVDIFAPYYVTVASFSNKIKTNEKQKGVIHESGTSFSSPIAAGVAATLISEHPEITFNQDIMKQMLIDLSIKGAINDLDHLNTPNRFINIGKQVVYSTDSEYKGCGIGSGKKSCPAGKCCSAKGYCGNKTKYCEIDCQSEFGHCSANSHSAPSAQEKPKKKSKFRDTLIFNYYNDLEMCVKYIPDNDINENIIMTVCKNSNIYNINNIWNIANEGDTKISENFYEDTCIQLDENSIVYADDCKNGVIFKDIMTVPNRDAIQTDAFPGKCLKAVKSDFDPYGITLFTDKHGVRVMMGDCDPSDDSQHWRFREVPEPFDENAYLDDGPIDDDFIDGDDIYDDDIGDDIDEESEFPSETDITEEEKEILYDKYDQIINLNEYLEYDKFKYSVITNTKKVWIYNEDLNLCLCTNGGYNQDIFLDECDKEDNSQRWYVPDNNKGYYINVKNDKISIIYTPLKKLVYDKYKETITLSKKYVRNNSSIITYEDGFLKIYDKLHNEKVCIDVPEEEKSNKKAYANVVPCNETTTYWKLTTEYPSN